MSSRSGSGLWSPMSRKLPDADLLRRLQCVAKDDIGLFREVVGRDDVIRLVEIHRIDAVLVDELDEIQCPSALELYALDLFRIEKDIMPFRNLVSLDDLVAVDRAYARNHFFIFDALSARLVDLVELNLRTALGRREQLDGNRNQR